MAEVPKPHQPIPERVVVIVNGQEHNTGIETKTTENGKSTVTIKVNSQIIESKIDEAVKKNPGGTGNVINVPVTDTDSQSCYSRTDRRYSQKIRGKHI